MSPKPETPTVACPTCNGPLTASAEEWKCDVGHHFGFLQLRQDQADAVVRTLWYALRALEDRAISSKYAMASYERFGLGDDVTRLQTERVRDLEMADRLHELLQRIDDGAEIPDDLTGAGSHADGPDSQSDS